MVLFWISVAFCMNSNIFSAKFWENPAETQSKFWATLMLWNNYTLANWTWYLVVDFICFLFVPLILLVHSINRKAGLILTSIIILGSVVATWTVCYVQNINFNAGNFDQSWYVNIGIYCTGCLFAQ